MTDKPKYEIGGFLVDANGTRHEIVNIGGDMVAGKIFAKASGTIYETVISNPSHYVYEPPPRILSLQEAIEAAKAGETVENVGMHGNGGRGYIYHKTSCGDWLRARDLDVADGILCPLSAAHLTGWRIVPKAKPLPAMTERLAKALDDAGTYSSADVFGKINAIRYAWSEAKGEK